MVSIVIVILTVILIWNKRLQREIAERKLAQEAPQENWARYASLFERSMDTVYANDLEGNFIDSNQVGMDLLGYSKDEISSINITTILEEEHIPAARESVAEILETGVPKSMAVTDGYRSPAVKSAG